MLNLIWRRIPEGEKVSKKDVDHALSEESGRLKKKEESAAATPVTEVVTVLESTPITLPWDEAPTPPVATPVLVSSRSKVNPGKVRQVAEILGLSDEDEEDILVRLIDEFLAMKNA